MNKITTKNNVSTNTRELITGNLALSDEILLNIEKPARYIGGEVNAVVKDKDKVDIRFAMCFPDVYEIRIPPGTHKKPLIPVPNGLHE